MALLNWTKEQKEAYYQDNVRLIYSTIKSIRMKSHDFEDIFQIASIGFLKALDTFDDERGIKLSTYITNCMQNEVFYETRKERAKCRNAHVLPYESTAQGKDGREMAGLDNMDLEKVDGLHEYKLPMEEIVENNDMADTIRKVMKEHLTNVEYTTMMMFADDHTQHEIAEKLNISQANVSKIIRLTRCKIILHLRRGGYIEADQFPG